MGGSVHDAHVKNFAMHDAQPSKITMHGARNTGVHFCATNSQLSNVLHTKCSIYANTVICHYMS